MRFFLFLAKGGLIAITPHKTASEIRGRTDKDTSQTKATLHYAPREGVMHLFDQNW